MFTITMIDYYLQHIENGFSKDEAAKATYNLMDSHKHLSYFTDDEFNKTRSLIERLTKI